MRPSPQSSFAATLLLLCPLPLFALHKTSLPHPAPQLSFAQQASSPLESTSILASLKEDVAQHPDSYLVFATRIAAARFFAEHLEAQRETDPTMIDRGILGYCGGKTVAVVPLLTDLTHLTSRP